MLRFDYQENGEIVYVTVVEETPHSSSLCGRLAVSKRSWAILQEAIEAQEGLHLNKKERT